MEEAGLHQRDVITAVDDVELNDESTLGRVLRGYRPGATVSLTVVRGAKTTTVKVRLGGEASGLIG